MYLTGSVTGLGTTLVVRSRGHRTHCDRNGSPLQGTEAERCAAALLGGAMHPRRSVTDAESELSWPTARLGMESSPPLEPGALSEVRRRLAWHVPWLGRGLSTVLVVSRLC